MKIHEYFRMANFSIDDFLNLSGGDKNTGMNQSHSVLASLPCQLQIVLGKYPNDSMNCTAMSSKTSHNGLAWLTSVLFVLVFPSANLLITGKSGTFQIRALQDCSPNSGGLFTLKH